MEGLELMFDSMDELKSIILDEKYSEYRGFLQSLLKVWESLYKYLYVN